MPEGVSSIQEVQDHADQIIQLLQEEISVLQYRPIGDRVLTKRLEPSRVQDKGKIVTVTDNENKPWIHLVLRVGKGVKKDIKRGDLVVSGRRVGHPQEIAGEWVRFVQDPDILGVIDPEDLDFDLED